MECLIKKLSAADLSIAKEFLIYWQTEDGIADINIPGDTYLLNLLSKDSFHMYIAMKDGAFAGGLTAYELPMYHQAISEMFLYEIGVDEQYRKQGLAIKLIDALIQTCREKGINILYAATETDSTPARKLYEATGGELEDIAWYTYDLNKS